MICELAIDTAGAGCSAALTVGMPDQQKTFARFDNIRRGHAEHIIAQIDDLMVEAGISYHSLNRISCTMGPGSFTGVRVGIAFAKGLALACDVPLYGAVCSVVAGQKFIKLNDELEFDRPDLDFNLDLSKSFHICHVLEAGRDEFYVHVFKGLGDEASGVNVLNEVTSLSEVTGPVLLSYSDVADFVQKNEVHVSFGPGADKFCELNRASNSGDPSPRFDVHSAALDIRAEDLFKLDEDCFKINDEVRPLYLRAPDAKPQLGKTLVRRL
ncbi:tRNA (adenosine(37)-N6)-threonylcarbamoyltransferase complex dimerization subunit type 1 TsaB [Hyphomicrobiales bacterium 4NK60-0047b]